MTAIHRAAGDTVRIVRSDAMGRRAVASQPLPAHTRVFQERGLAVPLRLSASDTCCQVCFAASTQPHAYSDEDCAAVLRGPAGQLEEELLPQLAALQAAPAVSDELLRLWLRVAAACLALAPRAAAAAPAGILGDWAAAIDGVAELGTSAPDMAWLEDVLLAAATFWQLLPPQAHEAVEKVLCPRVAESPAHVEQAAAAAAAEATESDASASPATAPLPSGIEALVVVAGQMNRNGYSVRDPAQPNVLRLLGMYPATATLNHSCAPNCAVLSWPTGVLEVRTLQPIAAGQELLVSYVDIALDCVSRRKQLRASKDFFCHCLRCDHPDVYAGERELSEPLCPSCSRGHLRQLGGSGEGDEKHARHICRVEDGGCGHVATSARIHRLTDKIRTALAELEAAASQRRQQPERHVQAATALFCAAEDALAQRQLSPRYWAVVQADLALAQLSLVSMEDAQALQAMAKSYGLGFASNEELAAHHMRRGVASLQAVLPQPHWPELCGWQLRFGSLLLELAAKRGNSALKSEGVAALQAARESSLLLYGPDHSLVQAIEARLK